jgi:hypothetical protein
MTGLFLKAWILYPIALLVICGGLGLLLRRASAERLPVPLVLPLGFAALVVIATFFSWIRPAAQAGGYVAAAVAVAGLVLERDTIRAGVRTPLRGWIWPLAAAAVGFGVIAAPVVLGGTPTWTGFARIVDVGYEMQYAHALADTGRNAALVHANTPAFGQTIGSSYDATVGGFLSGYPNGAQASLGATARAIGLDVPFAWQPFLAWLGAMGALAIFALLRTMMRSVALCALGAAIAIQPNILYGFALYAGIKELCTAGLVALTAALLCLGLPRRENLRSALPVGAALAAALASFSYGVLDWIGVLLLGAFVVAMWPRRGRLGTLGAWVLTGGVALLMALPTLAVSGSLFHLARTTASGGSVDLGLGALASPVPAGSALGVWFDGDFIYPALAHEAASHVFQVLVVVLAVVGVGYLIWRRRFVAVSFAVGTVIGLLYWESHTSGWVEMKAYCLAAVVFLLFAFVGSGALAERRNRWLQGAGWALALALGGAVLAGNALVYHDVSLAPAAAYRDLAKIGARFAGQGPTLYPAFDEYAEYFLRRENGVDLTRMGSVPAQPGLNLPGPGNGLFYVNINQFQPTFVQRFNLIVRPVGPIPDRPPANFSLAERTRYFEVWKRNAPASTVAMHASLSGLPNERDKRFCALIAKNVRKAGPGARVAFVLAPVETQLLPAGARPPRYWQVLGGGAVRDYGPGSLEGMVPVPRSGTYDVWMLGSQGRPLTFWLDGHRIGTIAYQERYPGLYLHLAQVKVSAGPHVLRVQRPGGGLHPGNGDTTDQTTDLFGPVVFKQQEGTNDRVQIVAASDAQRVCAAHVGYEWMEVLRTA